MVSQPDYFSNHRLKLRFPWRLYHDPIVRELGRIVRSSPGPDVLNVGSGPFFELERLERAGRRFTICGASGAGGATGVGGNIDPRAVALAREIHGADLVRADVVAAERPLPYADASFDLVVSMDVIEHVLAPVPWVRETFRVLKPNGGLFLTTPNYASRSLRVLESTALEAIARLQHFSRKHIHPSKMIPSRLDRVLSDAGAGAIRIETISHGWVLAACARKLR
jgi:SAM-dependent methyltransferase